MAWYRKIDCRIWNDEKVRKLNRDEVLAFLYLLTHQHMTRLGAMRATVDGLASEVKWLMPTKDFRKAMAKAFSLGLAEADDGASFLALPHFLRYNAPESPKVVKHFAVAFDLLPDCKLKLQLWYRVIAFLKTMPKSFLLAWESLPERLSKDYGKDFRYLELELEQELDPPSLSPPRGDAPASFETYRRKFVEVWNTLGAPFPRIADPASKQLDKLKARWADKRWRERAFEAIRRMPRCPFLRGEGGSTWKSATVSFFLRPQTVDRILGGEFDGQDERDGAEDESDLRKRWRKLHGDSL